MQPTYSPDLTQTYQHWAHLDAHFTELKAHQHLFSAEEQILMARRQKEATEKAEGFRQKLQEQGHNTDELDTLRAQAQAKARLSVAKTVQYKYTTMPFAVKGQLRLNTIDTMQRTGRARSAQCQLAARNRQHQQAMDTSKPVRGIAPKSHTELATHAPAGSGYFKR